MNKVLIVDASDSERRLMSGLLARAGYEPIVVENMEAAQQEVTKLSPGAVIVTAMKFRGGTARELIDWLKTEGYKFPVLAKVDNLIPMEIIDVMCDWSAVTVRPQIMNNGKISSSKSCHFCIILRLPLFPSVRSLLFSAVLQPLPNSCA